MDRFLSGATAIPGLSLYGIASRNRLDARVPTFSFRLAGRTPQEVASRLADDNIFVWAGDFYAHEASARLSLRDRGGLIRVGLSHYTAEEEVDRVLDAVARLAG
jgi:selenocysteine lyase/cysteine desulfurase